jgi:hypothetical protein
LALRTAALKRFDRGVVGPPSERAMRRHLLALFRERGHRCFVESGTYLGDTVQFMLPHAHRIISVELDDELWQRARERFRGEPAVEIIHGDAELLLPEIVAGLSEPPLIFLDGHFSGPGTSRGTQDEPAVVIVESLGRTGLPTGTTIVVDDIRLFGLQPGMPSLQSLTSTVSSAWPDAQLYTGLDSLVVKL